MPMDRSKYPLDWDAISARIRERDGQRCKWCGLPNGALIMRSLIDPARYVILKDDGIHYNQDGRAVRLSEMPEELDREKYTRVVLTVHHIGVDKPDGTPGDRHDKLDCRDENLAALCQRCHFKADWDIHFAAATAARIAKRHAGQRPLPGGSAVTRVQPGLGLRYKSGRNRPARRETVVQNGWFGCIM